MTDDLVGRQTVHVRDDLDAYYFGFEPTGNADVDRILGAIAYAGKAYHHTEDWDDASVIGVSCVGNIQNAAALAAARIEALEAEKALFRQVFERLDQGRGPGHCHAIPGIWDNDSSNGDKAGTPCDWCALWSEVRAALTPEAPHAD